MRWLTNQSDDVSSVRAAHYDLLQGDYAFTDPYLIGTVYHEHVIHKNLARKMDSILPAIVDEVKTVIDETFGVDTAGWKDVPVADTVMKIFARVSNRMFVGLPLCRNEDFLKNNSAFAMDVIALISLLPFFPKWTHPVVGRLMAIPNNIHYWRTRRHTMPIIKQRLKDIIEDEKLDVPEDYITWHIRTAHAEGRQKELEPEVSSLLDECPFLLIDTLLTYVLSVRPLPSSSSRSSLPPFTRQRSLQQCFSSTYTALTPRTDSWRAFAKRPRGSTKSATANGLKRYLPRCCVLTLPSGVLPE